MRSSVYQAVLRDNRIEWRNEVPPQLALGRELSVEVTIVQDPNPGPTGDRGARMAAALDRLAASNAVAAIEDPIAWQRELRQDRPLPGRD